MKQDIFEEIVEEAVADELSVLSDTEFDEQYILQLAEDFVFFCEQEVKIVDADSNVIPFVLNPPQVRATRHALRELLAGRPLLMVILKLRQEAGFSTWVAALLSWLTIFMDNYRAMVISHDDDSTDTLLEKYTFMYSKMSPDVRPEVDRSARKLGVHYKNGSFVRIATAGTSAVAAKKGRSKTLQAVHFSEVAFYAAPKKLVTAVKSAMGARLGPWRIIILESSPCGKGGYFYDEYMRAKNGESEFKAWFVPWHAVPKNTIKPAPTVLGHWRKWRKHGRASDREAGGFLEDSSNRIETYDLSCGQWLWWCYCYRNVCDGDEERMLQEYPDDDVSCFLASGRQVFAAKFLAAQNKHLFPSTRFDLSDKGPTIFKTETEVGQFEGWLDPEEGTRYIITADICGGGTGDDFSVITAWARRGRAIEQCAAYIGKPDPDEVGVLMDILGRFYNNAIVCPESNTYGKTTLKELRKLSYPNIYRELEWSRAEGKLIRNKLGWETTAKTRPMLVSAARKALRSDSTSVIIHDDKLVTQLSNFVWVDGMRCEAQPGENDDYVFSFMIACALHDEHYDLDLLYNDEKPREEGAPPKWSTVSELVDEDSDEHSDVESELLELGFFSSP